MKAMRRLLYRYDIDGHRGVGLITTKRNRITGRFVTGAHQAGPDATAVRISEAEYGRLVKEIEAAYPGDGGQKNDD